MLCCAVLCCAVLCCAVLCCAVLCCAVQCCAVLCCAVLCCAVLFLCHMPKFSRSSVRHCSDFDVVSRHNFERSSAGTQHHSIANICTRSKFIWHRYIKLTLPQDPQQLNSVPFLCRSSPLRRRKGGNTRLTGTLSGKPNWKLSVLSRVRASKLWKTSS